MLDKREYIIMLKDFYGSLLTDKQQSVLEMYYEHDLSLSEIAEDMEISRQAVYDLLKRAENLLKEYEDKLELVDRFLLIRDRIKEVGQMLHKNEDCSDRKNIDQAIKMLEEIADLL